MGVQYVCVCGEKGHLCGLCVLVCVYCCVPYLNYQVMVKLM